MKTKLKPIHPGEILLIEFMEPMGISQNKLSRDIDVPVTRVFDIVHGKRGISTDTALRLSAYFGTTAEFWLNLQTRFDLKRAKAESWADIEGRIRPIKESVTV